MWFGTPGRGVSRFDGTNWQTFTEKDGLGDNYILSIFADDRGNVWFGSGEGVTRYDGTTWRTFTSQDGLADDEIRCIFQDNRGFLWFGTFTGGLSCYETQ
jgi:ligand-binding sensor domain-containing protein